MVYADWPNYIFHVPRADLTLVQSSPTEIRECNLNWLRLQILSLEDDPEAMTFPTVFSHFPEVTLGSLTFAKVMEMLEPYTITFEDGQYAVDLTGANSNFGDRVNVNQVSVRSSNSAGMTSSPAIEYLAFDNRVTMDIGHGTEGQSYPIGTVQYPSNNLEDVTAIADYRQITKIHFKHHSNILDNDYDYTGFVLSGDAQATTSLHVEPLPNLSAALVKGLTFSGTVDGGLAILDCKVNGVTFFSGSMRECGLTAEPVVLGGTGTATFNRCISLVAGANSRPQIDFDGEPTNLAVREWSGGLELVNKTNETGEVSIDMASGVVYIRDTCTAGKITLRGLAVCVDESGDGCNVDISGLQDPVQAQYNSKIYVDTNGISGTLYPIGLSTHPVNNVADAIVLADRYNCGIMNIVGDFTIPAGAYGRGYNVFGHGNTLTFEEGCDMEDLSFEQIKITGYLTGRCKFDGCTLYNLHGVYGPMFDCVFAGDVWLEDSPTAVGRIVNGQTTSSTYVNFHVGQAKLAISDWRGGMNLLDKTGPSETTMMLNYGGVNFDASNTGGSITVLGLGLVTGDTDGGTVVNSQYVWSKQVLAEATWSYERA